MYRQKGPGSSSATRTASSGAGSSSACSCFPTAPPESRDSLAWIAETLSPRVAISLMAQYYPIHRAAGDEKYAALDRSITAAEWEEARARSRGQRLENGFQQELETANKYYRPDFTDRETPFRDIRDFTGQAAAASPPRRRTPRPVRPARSTRAPAAVRH